MQIWIVSQLFKTHISTVIQIQPKWKLLSQPLNSNLTQIVVPAAKKARVLKIKNNKKSVHNSLQQQLGKVSNVKKGLMSKKGQHSPPAVQCTVYTVHSNNIQKQSRLLPRWNLQFENPRRDGERFWPEWERFAWTVVAEKSTPYPLRWKGGGGWGSSDDCPVMWLCWWIKVGFRKYKHIHTHTELDHPQVVPAACLSM